MVSRTAYLILLLLSTAISQSEEQPPSDLLLEEIANSESAEQHEFQADVSRVMDIFINSLYTHKEIFLRETISNASDALDKIRYLSLTNDEILGEGQERNLEIRVEFNKDEGTISVTDTGIGMTKQELVKNLGTVAKSGTTNFVEALASGSDINLIGQFGVGFYSNFLVADEIIVTSKHNDDDQHIWVSKASNTFTVFPDPRGDTLGRGTRITLKLKADSSEFLEEKTLKDILKKYSEFVQYPIYLKVRKEVSRDVPLTEEELAEREEGDTKTTKVIKESILDWELVNENKPIWLRDDVEDEEYFEFYKSIARDSRDPLTYIQFNAEGEVEFKALLFIPAQAPYDMFNNYDSKIAPLKLYVRRVMITDDFDELVPRYLNFIHGVVDSDDLPLNVARESIQQKKIIKLINKKLTRKILQELLDMADTEVEEGETDEYLEFYKQFGKNIKLGIMEDSSNKNKLARLLRFYSTHDLDKLISFDDYIYRMKDGQDDIYYIAGEDRKKLEKSPMIQKLVKSGYEVLLLDDPVDEYAFNNLQEYEKHKLQNVAQDNWSLPEEDDTSRNKEKKLKEKYAGLVEWLRGLVASRLSNIVVSRKLQDEPSIVSTTEHGYSANLEKIMKAQALTDSKKLEHNIPKKVWELNPAHPIIKTLDDYSRRVPSDKVPRDLAVTCLDIAMIQSGFAISDPVELVRRSQELIFHEMGVDPKEEISLPEVYLDEEEEEESENLDEEWSAPDNEL